MKRFNTDIGSTDAALKRAPKVFQAFGMNMSAIVFASVVDYMVNKSIIQSAIRTKRIGMYLRSGLNVLANFRLNRRLLSVADVFQFNVAFLEVVETASNYSLNRE